MGLFFFQPPAYIYNHIENIFVCADKGLLHPSYIIGFFGYLNNFFFLRIFTFLIYLKKNRLLIPFFFQKYLRYPKTPMTKEGYDC